jgi:hypothetical protein
MRMSKRLAAGVVGVGVAWSYFSSRHEAMKPLDPSEVTGRIWLESKTKSQTDYAQGLYLAPLVGYGTVNRSSMFDWHVQVMKYKRSASKLSVTFPQTGKTTDINVTVTPCNDMPPFDLCLDLSENPWGGPKRYHGTSKKSDEAAAVGSFATMPTQLDGMPVD